MSEDTEKQLSEERQMQSDFICKELASGKSLRSICEDPTMPHNSTVVSWARDYPAFTKQYTRAREFQADALFDEILDIVDDDDRDTHDKRLRMDARKWMAGKMRPKVYGDKLEIDLNDKAEPIPLDFVVEPAKGKIRVTKAK